MSKIANTLKAMAEVASKKKAKKADASKTDDNPLGLVADPKKEGIPVFLQTQNRDKVFPINAEAKAKLEVQNNKVRPFDQPKGMSDEEYQAHKNKQRIAEENKKAASAAAQPKTKKRPGAPADTFALKDLAREHKIDPRIARQIARANASTLKPLWAMANLKHVFFNKDKATVLKLIKAGPAKKEVPVKGEKAINAQARKGTPAAKSTPDEVKQGPRVASIKRKK